MTIHELPTGDLTSYGDHDDPATVLRATIEGLLMTLEPQLTDSTTVQGDFVAGPEWIPLIGSLCRALADATATRAAAPCAIRAVVDSDAHGGQLLTRRDRLS